MIRDVLGVLTIESNAVVRPHHGNAMSVILTMREERQLWLNALEGGKGATATFAGRHAGVVAPRR
jgi:putative SOS response-associated peptidase YedK